MKPLGLLVIIGVLLAACQASQDALRIGVRPDTERMVLAQMVRQVIEGNSSVPVQMVDCQDWIDCAGKLLGKEVDITIGYSGTGYMFRRHLTASQKGSFEEVRKLYEPSDIQWLGPFGFDNAFLLVVSNDKAKTVDLKRISDLNKMKDGVKITAPSSYVRRPVDGLPGLLRHYGIKMRGKVLVIDDSFRRLLALHEGRADVAIVSRTDGALRDVSFTSLKDNRHFYPKYEAAILTRKDVLITHPKLREILQPLKGKVSKDIMQGLNYQVKIEGLNPSLAAHRFLRNLKIVAREPISQSRKPELIIAMDERGRFGGLTTFLVRVVREVFPDHHVVLQPSEDAVEDVGQGKARLAVIGANRLVPITKGQLYSTRDNRIEAVAVLETGYLHVLRRRNDRSVKDPLAGKIGVPLQGSDRAQLALSVLSEAQKENVVYGETSELVEKVKNKTLDAALIFHLLGDKTIQEALGDKKLVLRAVSSRLENLPQYLIPVRIPRGTYPRQTKGLQTLGVQIVIAGPSPKITPGPLGGGPGGALLPQNPPVTIEQANALAQAIGNLEPPDPMVPSVWLRTLVQGPGTKEGESEHDFHDTSLNIAILAFLGWLGLLLIRRSPR